MRRRSTGKRLRYSILARDMFTCRYCGARADGGAVLVVDHIIPVALGGTDDPENLITACEPCNQGKAAQSPVTAAPTPTDLARLARSVEEQRVAAELVRQTALSRGELHQELVNLWCRIRKVEEISDRTLTSLVHWHETTSIDELAEWIAASHRRYPYWADT